MTFKWRARGWAGLTSAGGLALALATTAAIPGTAGATAPDNLALNTTATGVPSPLGSDPGWGGGSYPWDIVDGAVTYPAWQHGLAFTGGHTNGVGSDGWIEPCGVRQATIDFGSNKGFSKVVIWHHGDYHAPAEANLAYWDGSTWQPITFTRNFGAVTDYSAGYGATSDEYTFSAVQGSKVRYSFDNCGNAITGIPNVHGWIYEFEVFATAGSGAGTDATHVQILGGSLSVDQPNVGDFADVTMDGTPKTTTASVDPFAVTDATGTGAGWELTAQATQFAEVDGSGNYVSGGKTLPSDSLSMDALSVAPDGTTSPPPTAAGSPYVLDGAGAVTLLTAATDTGMGRFVVTPSGLTLSVPSNAYARQYRSDVTLSLVSGP